MLISPAPPIPIEQGSILHQPSLGVRYNDPVPFIDQVRALVMVQGVDIRSRRIRVEHKLDGMIIADNDGVGGGV